MVKVKRIQNIKLPQGQLAFLFLVIHNTLDLQPQRLEPLVEDVFEIFNNFKTEIDKLNF